MGAVWFGVAAVCILAGLVLLWLDRRRRRPRPAAPPPPTPPGHRPGDLFREHPPP